MTLSQVIEEFDTAVRQYRMFTENDCYLHEVRLSPEAITVILRVLRETNKLLETVRKE